MAKKRRRTRGLLKSFLLFILTPLVIWFFAFLIWLNWDEVARLAGNKADTAKAPPGAASAAKKSGSASSEKILDEDRKKLEEILQQRQ